MQANIFKSVFRDQRERLGHAVDERFAADKTSAGMIDGFGDHMLAAAETNLKPNVVDVVEQRAQRRGRFGRKIERKARKQRFEQRGLARPQFMALAPAEESSRPAVIALLISAQRHGANGLRCRCEIQLPKSNARRS